MFNVITPLFLIEFQKLKKGNAQKFLLFHLLFGQKELAPFVWKLEPFRDDHTGQIVFSGCFFFMFTDITPLFLIEFKKLKKGNAQKFLLFQLLFGQKELAPFV